MGLASKIFGTHSEREIKRIQPIVAKIVNLREQMTGLSDEGLKDKTKEFKKRLTVKLWMIYCRRHLRLSGKRREEY